MMYKGIFLLTLLACLTGGIAAASDWDGHGPLQVSKNGRYLEHKDGTPFFYLGDTAWELFHRLTREEADRYLEDRAAKGYTVIQAVVLAELDGLHTPNAYGYTPLVNDDPTRPAVKDGPNNDYWDHVDYIVEKAASLGLVIGMLPTWGDKWNLKWGVGPEIFDSKNAEVYGRYVGARYKHSPIIWILGGDRPLENGAHFAIIRAMAKGLEEGDGGVHLMTLHASGRVNPSKWLHQDAWLDFNMFQSGHGERYFANHEMTLNDRSLAPVKPVLDGEPCYEDHPVKDQHWRDRDKPGVYLPWFDEWDVRKAAYSSMFSGALGHTYGNHNIWQMLAPGRDPISIARTPWTVALDHPGARQMGYMKDLLLARPFNKIVPAQELIVGGAGSGADHIRACRANDASFALLYIPTGRTVTVDLAKTKIKKVTALWFNPRQNTAQRITDPLDGGEHTFTPPYEGRNNDWILVLDDAALSLPRVGASTY